MRGILSSQITKRVTKRIRIWRKRALQVVEVLHQRNERLNERRNQLKYWIKVVRVKVVKKNLCKCEYERRKKLSRKNPVLNPLLPIDLRKVLVQRRRKLVEKRNHLRLWIYDKTKSNIKNRKKIQKNPPLRKMGEKRSRRKRQKLRISYLHLHHQVTP